eukprot:scaffold50536_cov66-Phaeocystis_antarctica.AAC.7
MCLSSCLGRGPCAEVRQERTAQRPFSEGEWPQASPCDAAGGDRRKLDGVRPSWAVSSSAEAAPALPVAGERLKLAKAGSTKMLRGGMLPGSSGVLSGCKRACTDVWGQRLTDVWGWQVRPFAFLQVRRVSGWNHLQAFGGGKAAGKTLVCTAPALSRSVEGTLTPKLDAVQARLGLQ